VDVAELLEERLTFIRETTEHHRFVLNTQPVVPSVRADKEKLGQIVDNLLNNAVKYSPMGGSITVSAYDDLALRRVIISITDEGIGISPEDRNLLFTTFHRINRPETRTIPGTGLGLYIAKEWTEAMGGKIWLESELNKGSTFFLGFPSNGSRRK
jgi:signal transduction histidine kinase